MFQFEPQMKKVTVKSWSQYHSNIFHLLLNAVIIIILQLQVVRFVVLTMWRHNWVKIGNI